MGSIRRTAVALTGLTALLLLLAAACGGDDGADRPTTPPTTEAATTTATTAHEADHQDDGPATAEPDHEHGEGREWTAGPVPVITVSVSPNPAHGWDVTATIDGEFTFTDVDTIDHVDGEGHTHLVVDGRAMAMVYEPTVHLDDLTPGTHTVEVTLASNGHSDYLAGGEVISGSTEVTVEGEQEDADVVVEIELVDGAPTEDPGRVDVPLGGMVRLSVSADMSDEVHVHGYDVYGELAAGQTIDIEFVADIPGIFEVELEGSGVLLVELVVS